MPSSRAQRHAFRRKRPDWSSRSPAAPRPRLPSKAWPSGAMPASYSLNVRVFWPLVTCGCTALFCLLQALRSKGGAAAAAAAPTAWDCGSAGPLLKASLLCLPLAYLALRWRALERPGGHGASGGARGSPARRRQQRRRGALQDFYAQQLRLSPHVLGHSKAHVSLVVGEVVRAGKGQGQGQGQGRLALRGDFVQVGSAYEQHKVGRPDAFDVLVPLRLPPRLRLRVRPRRPDEAASPRGAFVCALEVASDEGPGVGPLNEALCVELPGPGPGGSRLSSALVLRWFQGHVQRCLDAVRSRLQERGRVSLALGPSWPLTLHIAPRSDYVCCHLSMAVRLLPAVPLGDSLYLTPLGLGSPRAAACWTLNVSRQEQRLLGWLREQGPGDACHLKCLQLLKGLRDLGGRSLEQPLGAQWNAVLSSYVLKTALFWLLLRSPLQAWQDQFLVERLGDLVAFLADGLRRRRLRHLFLGNPGLPDALGLPKLLKEAAPVNLLADFDGPTLDRVAAQLLSTWKQLPKMIRMYHGHRSRRSHPV